MTIFALGLREALARKDFSLGQKALRLLYSFALRLGLGNALFTRIYKNQLIPILSGYDTLIVLSEASKLRDIVAATAGVRKVQWIHVDYSLWRRYTSWSRQVSARDAVRYEKYDCIVTLSEKIREGFVACHPHLEQQTVSIANLFFDQPIRSKSLETCPFSVTEDGVNLITVCRFDLPKALDRLVRVARRLDRDGLVFHWYLVGDGMQFELVKGLIDEYGLAETITLTGMMANPYPLLAQCDLFVLPSDYEGLPVVINESLALGVPVAATDVGGVSEQFDHGVHGILMANDESVIYHSLRDLIQNPDVLSRFRGNLKGYQHDNLKIIRQLEQVFNS